MTAAVRQRLVPVRGSETRRNLVESVSLPRGVISVERRRSLPADPAETEIGGYDEHRHGMVMDDRRIQAFDLSSSATPHHPMLMSAQKLLGADGGM